jgi:ribonuclease T1
MKRLWWATLAAMLLAVAAWPGWTWESSGRIGAVELEQLPPEAAQTLRLIQRGGPFPYRKDGTAFQNRERKLPHRPTGYYREYTVPTPGSPDRGARRIVAGKGATGDVRTSGEYYYTADHYRSFRRIQQ